MGGQGLLGKTTIRESETQDDRGEASICFPSMPPSDSLSRGKRFKGGKEVQDGGRREDAEHGLGQARMAV